MSKQSSKVPEDPRDSNRSGTSSKPATVEEKDAILSSILDSCTEFGVIALDLDLKIIFWNEGARRLFLYEPDEIVGKMNLSNIQDPEDLKLEKIKKILDEIKQSGIWSGEFKGIRKDGKTLSFPSTMTARTLNAGKVIGYTLICQDQTELNSKLKLLTESKEYTRSLIESNLDVLVTTDPLGVINDVNQKICEMTECSREELIGSPFKKHFTDPKRAEDLIRKVLSENLIINYELIIQSKNEKITPVSFNATTFRTTDGHLKGIFATARNITEQKRLEDQSLKQSSDLLEATNFLSDVLKSSIAYSIMALDLEGNILIWNEGAKRNYGYSAEEMVGKKTLWVLHTPEDIDSGRAKTMLDEALKTGNYEGEFQRLRKNGERFPALLAVTVRRDANGKPVGYVLISKDITVLKQQEQALREQLSYSRSLFDYSIDVLMATDTLGIITDANKQMSIVTGYSTEELIGTEFKNYFSDPKRAEDCIRKVLYEDRLTNYELTIQAKDGKETVISCNASTFKGMDQNLKGVFVVGRDITEQKRLEVESIEQTSKLKEATVLVSKTVELEEENRLSQEANRLKSEFLANMSHELRSPLNGIIGFAELMHLGKVGPVSAEHKEYLGDILTSSRHLLQLINDILDLAKVESGKMEFHPEAVELNTVITEVCDILRTLISKKKIQLSIIIDPSIKNIVIDPSKLKQALYNYISNALKFTKEEGLVTIRVLPEGTDNFRIEVEDTGIGIREEDIPKLFSEFQQLDAGSDKRYQGTGLGLALTKRIAEAQGGQVGVKSIINKGSVFFIILPKIPLKIEEPVPQATKPLPFGIQNIGKETSLSDSLSKTIDFSDKKEKIPEVESPEKDLNILGISEKSKPMEESFRKILVIEDDTKDSELIRKTLSDVGYSVETVFTGTEAIKICREKQFDAITLDLLLPDMNGWDVLRAFRAQGPNLETPTVVVTVVGSKAASFGFMIQSFLIKPITSQELISTLQRTGIYENQNKTILILDDDPKMLTLSKEYLKDYGSTLLCETIPEKALEVAEIQHPDAIILDLLMPEIDGLEFLRRFRLTAFGKKTPVIICTSQDISDVDRTRIKASISAVIQKGGGSMQDLVTEINRICPIEGKK